MTVQLYLYDKINQSQKCGFQKSSSVVGKIVPFNLMQRKYLMKYKIQFTL